MKALRLIALLFSATIFMVACGGPKTSGSDAKTEDAKEVPVAEAAVSYALDMGATKVEWVGQKIPTTFGGHEGIFPVKSGDLKVEGGNLVGGKVVIDVANVDVTDIDETAGKGKLLGHLKSVDFFAADSFPEAMFEITGAKVFDGSMAAESAEGAEEWGVENPTHYITGNLTLRGTTKSITFPAEVKMEGDKIMANARFFIDRTNWNVNYMTDGSAAAKDFFIRDKVNIGLSLSANKQS